MAARDALHMLARMASRAQWAKRVAEWRRSGLTSDEFCAGKDFTAGGLRNAACLIDGGAAVQRKALIVPVAKVIRTSVPATRVSPPASAAARALGDVELMVELGAARVAVRRGCDAATLMTVVEVLSRVGGAR